MKGISFLIAAAAVVGFAGTASASHNHGHDTAAENAAIQCASPSGPEGGPPGFWFQQLRDATGENPANADPAGRNPAELIHSPENFCEIDNDPS